MKRLLFILALVLPFNIYADTISGLKMTNCQRMQSPNNLSASGNGTFKSCMVVTCSNGLWDFNPSPPLTGRFSCANGNPNPKFTLTFEANSSECGNIFKGTCSGKSVDKTFNTCINTYIYDCNKTSNGDTYVPRKTTIATTKKTTTKATTRRTSKKTTTKRTTTSTTTKPTTTVPVTTAKDSNSSLRELTIENHEILFDKNIHDYSIDIDKSELNIKVTAIPESSVATVKIENNENIKTDLPIIITVTAEDGTASIYTVYFKIDNEELSSNSTIKEITIKNHSIDFDSSIFSYDISIKEKEKKLDISVILTDKNATYEIIGNEKLGKGKKITIKVTAEDKEATSEYTINITSVVKEKSNNTIIIIVILIGACIIGYFLFKLIRNLIPAKVDEKYDYE